MPPIFSSVYRQQVQQQAQGLHRRNPEMARLLLSTAEDTLSQAVMQAPGWDGHPLDGETEIITGDIPAQWLRDSVVQVEPLWTAADSCPTIRQLLSGLVRRLSRAVCETPYANAFRVRVEPGTRARLIAQGIPAEWMDGPSPHSTDQIPEEISRAGAWEMKWEVDSLGWYLRLVRRWLKMANPPHQASQLTPLILQGLGSALRVLLTEMSHGRASRYRFHRPGGDPRDQLPPARGPQPGLLEGLWIWGGFRPSDDRCLAPYHLPSNLQVAFESQQLARILGELCPAAENSGVTREFETSPAPEQLIPDSGGSEVWLVAGFQYLARRICQGLTAILDHQQRQFDSGDLPPSLRRVLPYEVHGDLTGVYDEDPNLPSLTSLPWTGVPTVNPGIQFALDDHLAATREWFRSGQSAAFVSLMDTTPDGLPIPGPTSIHTPKGWVWPLGLASMALAESDREGRWAILGALARLCPDGQAHESVDPGDPRSLTRPWFAMGNAVTAQALLAVKP